MSQDCIFCKIVAKESPAEIIDETDKLLVFKDKFPSAPIHFVIIPKEHFVDVSEINSELWNKMRETAIKLAQDQNLTGFRLATNAGDTAMIGHMHMHFLAGIKKDRSV